MTRSQPPQDDLEGFATGLGAGGLAQKLAQKSEKAGDIGVFYRSCTCRSRLQEGVKVVLEVGIER